MTVRLALAPVSYYWPKEAVYRFYDAVPDMPVDVVYLGETVCAKRHALREEDWLDIGRRLQEAGKEVVLSTQVLLESDTHLQTMRRIVQNGVFPVEANDMGAVRLLAGKASFIAGASLNISHPQAWALMSAWGGRRWVMPVEMGQDGLAGMMASRQPGSEVEVFGYGRLPLAFSARCFTARHYNLSRDECGFRCLEHPEGLCLKTQEGEDFLVINGIQTQSARIYCLVRELPVMQKMGVDIVRISPQPENTAEIVRLYAAVLAGKETPDIAFRALEKMASSGLCNGYWHGYPGMAYVRQDGKA
ncbi:MAG: U32 family peptidase [Alistipes senegalensis]|nr:U32 family peptidase [Oxalobacter formigenes]MCM1281663.1 U32 family peptidase [Alistipes senegalensis]